MADNNPLPLPLAGTLRRVSGVRLRRKRLSFQTKIADIHFTMTAPKEDWLARADDTLQTLRSLRPLSADAAQRLREEIKLETTYDSNAIEGSTLTLRETVLVVKEGVDCIPGKPIRDVLAARGFAAGFDTIFSFVENGIPLTVSLISEFHKYVMLGALPEFCGVFRDHNVRILGTHCKTAEHWEIPERIQKLVDRFNTADNVVHPIEKAARFHAAFETIHPFSDGNGRTGRLLLNYMLVREGFWPVNIRYAEDRVPYYGALASYNETGNAEDLTCLIAQRATEQLEYCIEIARQLEAAQAMRQQC